jgi:vancomycin resistance protein YoaR
VPRRLRIGAALAVAAVAASAVAAVLIRDAVYWERPLPGVSVSAVDLERPVAVHLEGREVVLRPAEALVPDARATALAEVQAGRGSFRTRIRQLADPSPPAIAVAPVLRQSAALDALVERLSETLRPPTPARVERRGATFAALPSRPGETIDRAALLAALERAARGGATAFTAKLAHLEPKLDTAAAETAAAAANALAAAPVALAFAGDTVGALAPERLAKLIRFEGHDDSFVVAFDRARLAKAVEPALTPWRKRARNAQFRLAGNGVRILPSAPGLEVDATRVLAEVTAAASARERVATLKLKQVPPELTTREAQRLGIRERISTFTTDMGTSSSNRIHNVHLMADYIDGHVVKPGEVFSFNDSVGPRTEERGFREGQMIIGSLLVPSIGGGVCQTATTLFNNAYELGLPIVERHNHSFYISHYPLGRDATVSWGGPDFKFRNDLDSAILVKTRYTDSTLTFSFYGTKPGRRVVTSTSERSNWRTPRVSYALDPYAPRGSVRTVSGSNQSGFDVTVYRRVYEHGKLLRKDTVSSAYVAVGPTQIYGPGRSIPGPYFVLPRV